MTMPRCNIKTNASNASSQALRSLSIQPKSELAHVGEAQQWLAYARTVVADQSPPAGTVTGAVHAAFSTATNSAGQCPHPHIIGRQWHAMKFSGQPCFDLGWSPCHQLGGKSDFG
jgi:hypothetical protein